MTQFPRTNFCPLYPWKLHMEFGFVGKAVSDSENKIFDGPWDTISLPGGPAVQVS